MRKMHKLALVGLMGLLPFGALADEHKYFMNDSAITKNANYKFEGKIEKMPIDGFNGTWIVSGRTILVDENTKIYQEENQIKIKDELKVIAQRIDGIIKALVIVHDD